MTRTRAITKLYRTALPMRKMGHMVTAAFLLIGNELLSGKVQEANLAELAKLLRRLGVDFQRAVMVQDDIETIVREVRSLRETHDWVFTSGGVGPTHDDVTIEAVSRAFGRRVVVDAVLESQIRTHYGDRVKEGHLRMALVPEGAALEVTEAVPWPVVRVENTWVLPGVPEAFRRKLEVIEAVWPTVAGVSEPFLSRAVFVKLDEGELMPLLEKVVTAYPAISVGSYPKWFDPSYKTKLTFDGKDALELETAVSAFLALLPPGEPQRTE